MQVCKHACNRLHVDCGDLVKLYLTCVAGVVSGAPLEAEPSSLSLLGSINDSTFCYVLVCYSKVYYSTL